MYNEHISFRDCILSVSLYLVVLSLFMLQMDLLWCEKNVRFDLTMKYYCFGCKTCIINPWGKIQFSLWWYLHYMHTQARNTHMHTQDLCGEVSKQRGCHGEAGSSWGFEDLLNDTSAVHLSSDHPQSLFDLCGTWTGTSQVTKASGH